MNWAFSTAFDGKTLLEIEAQGSQKQERSRCAQTLYTPDAIDEAHESGIPVHSHPTLQERLLLVSAPSFIKMPRLYNELQ